MDEPRKVEEAGMVFLLRFGGTVMLTAFGAMVMPETWMVAAHRWLGLGEFPRFPVVEYLTRSVAALYGFHGGLLWVVASDVRRHRPIVVYLASMNVLFGLMVLAIDLHAGLPWYWTAAEGPPVAALGLLLFHLLRRSRTVGGGSW